MVNNLLQLTVNTKHLIDDLKNSIKGQDEAINTFATGIFAAEMLTESDDGKRQPQAIFLFAGPPGVGKTLMAELAADYLEIPFKRFDMSSYSDYQAHMGLIGYDRSYQAAKRGTLTGFVNDNPHCILLFDEIEKAHVNTIHLFLQILDAGRLRDRYLNKVVDFKETIIIFTTNAGKILYDTPTINDGSISRKRILEAIEKEKNPQTGCPFFPPSIISRLATGWPILFKSLDRRDLEMIISMELERLTGLFELQYGIKVVTNENLPAVIYEREGISDARALRAQTELYFKNRIYQFCNDILSGEVTAEVEQIMV